MKRLLRFTFTVIVLLALFSSWYFMAANYEYGALAGTYIYDHNGVICVLDLRADKTFTEKLIRSGTTRLAQGRWDRYGEAHVSFSREFLVLSHEELNASGEAHGQFKKTLGVFPELVLAPLPDGPRLYKTFFHRGK